MADNMLMHALAYAKRGWPVFPCDPKTKRPLLPPDKDSSSGKEIKGTGGLHKASTVEETIRGWWKRWPKAMIGVPMGARSGVFAVDLDLGEPQLIGGDEYLERFAAHVDRLPETAIAETASGGIHIYFIWENARPVKNNGKRLVPALTIEPPNGSPENAKGAGVDCRGEGGYVIVPPSARADGKAYKWREAPWAKGHAGLNVATATERIYEIVFGQEAKAKPKTPPAVKPPIASSAEPALIGGESPGDRAVRLYALAALDLACRDLKGAVAGEKNNLTNTTAFSLGTLVGAGALRESVVRAELQAIVAMWPNPEKMNDVIERALAAGKAKPRDLREVSDKADRRAAAPPSSPRPPAPADPADYEFSGNAPNGGMPPGEEAGAEEFGSDQPSSGGSGGNGRVTGRGAAGGGGRKRRDTSDDDFEFQRSLHPQCAFLPQTDLGNAERFVMRNTGRFIYTPALEWLYWTGTHWSRDGADERVKIAEHETVRYIQDEAEWLAGSKYEQQVSVKHRGKKDPTTGESIEEPIMLSDMLRSWGRASEENRRLTPISKRGLPYLAVTIDMLDADPYKINLANGTLVVHPPRKDKKAWIEFKDHDPKDLITKIAPVDYDEGADCPIYDEFLSDVQRDDDMRRFLHQWGGLSLTADISEQRLVFFWGKGRNGKSTLLEIWAYVAGDYGAAAQIETFVNMGQQRNGGAPSPDLAMLRGRRFIHTNEPERGAKISESLVKLVTGGDTFPARELNCPFFQMRIVGKITMSGNFKPRIEGGDASHGIWRRMTLVPWTFVVPVEKVDKHLPERLKSEAPGILNHMLKGLLDWFDGGLRLPDEVIQATEKYREDSDPLGRFLSACTLPGTDNDRVQSAELHRVFCAWAKANGEREWTATGLGRALNERGFKSLHSNVNYWLGIRLTVSAGANGELNDAEGNALSAASTEISGDARPRGDVEF